MNLVLFLPGVTTWSAVRPLERRKTQRRKKTGFTNHGFFSWDFKVEAGKQNLIMSQESFD